MIWICNTFLCSVAFIILAIMFSSGLATEHKKWIKETYPNPYLHPRNCSRITQSYVCDPDDILTEGQADQLDSIILRIRNETTCLCELCPNPHGITIAVALLKAMSNVSESPTVNSAEAFANYLRQRWNFGQCDDDVLIFLSSADQKFHASVGSAVIDALADVAIRIFQVNRDIHFTTGYYYQGLESIMESYYDVLRQHNNKRHSNEQEIPSNSRNKDIMVALILSVTTLFALIVFVTIIIYRLKKTNLKHQHCEVGNSLTRWHTTKNKKSTPGDYERCNADEHCDDDNSSEGSSIHSDMDSEIISDTYQMNRMYITKRQLSAVPEESENEEENYDEVQKNGERTPSVERKSSANGIYRTPQLQDSAEE